MDPKIAREALIPNPGLEAFKPLVGTWATVGHHPMVPGVTFMVAPHLIGMRAERSW